MNIFNNEERILRKENDIQSERLREEDEYTIYKIMGSMNIFKVNSFDAQVIRRDLIGMASDAKLRQISLKDVIGEDLKQFVEDIINNSRGSSKVEIFLSFFVRLSMVSLFLLGLEAVFNPSPVWNLSVKGLILFIGAIVVYYMIVVYMAPKSRIENTWKRMLSMLSRAFVWLYILGGNNLMRILNSPTADFTVNPNNILLGLVIILIVSLFFYSRNIRKLSKDKRNYFDDLLDSN